MTPDAIVCLVKCAGEIRSLIGKAETFAPTQMFGLAAIQRKTPRLISIKLHQFLMIQFVRDLE